MMHPAVAAAAEVESVVEEQRLVGGSGALLLLASLLSGIYVAAAMTGQIAADARIALGAHVTGLIGALVLFAYAWSLPLLRYGRSGRTRIAYALVIGNFANLVIGSAKAIPAVHGVSLTGEPANDLVFGLLNLLVVAPLIIGTGAWVFGFMGVRR